MITTLEQPATRTATSPLLIGRRREDGMIFAGTSPTTGEPFYACPSDAPLVMTWKAAMVFAESFEGYGQVKGSFRLASGSELHVLYQHRNDGSLKGTFGDGGCFPDDWYWASDEFRAHPNDARMEEFREGVQGWRRKEFPASVRLVCD